MDYDIKGKRVLVQGASSGLGFAIAKAYVQEGAFVGISSSNHAKIQEAAHKLGSNVTPFVCDGFKEGSGTALVWQYIEKFGGIDILVTNTVDPPKHPFLETKLEDWHKSFQSVFMNVVECILEALHPMKEQKFGRLIFITSISAKEPIPGLTISSSLRPALLGLMKTLCHEIAQYHITVNSILPGFTKTEKLMQRMGAHIETISKTIPAQRLASPEELAALALFLGSKGASYINGQAIACDGGLLKGL
jgi:3-oxoacyl-[acyl-carrier protein] reductase